MTQAEKPYADVFMDTLTLLRTHMNSNNKVIEIDYDSRANYDTGHVPAAVLFDWKRDLTDPATGGILTRKQLEELFSRSGILQNVILILYGDTNNWFAGLAYRIFRYYGASNLRLVEGGRKPWVSEGKIMSKEVMKYPRTDYRLAITDEALRTRQDYLRETLLIRDDVIRNVASPREFDVDILALPDHIKESAQPTAPLNAKETGTPSKGGPNWEQWYAKKGKTVEPEVPKIVEEILKRQNKTKGPLRMLDLGCGNGRHMLYFAENGFDVYGFDYMEDAVKTAKDALAENNLRGQVVQFDMAKPLPYKDDFFDAIIATRAVQHGYKKDIEHVFNEMDRTMKSGGIVFVQVNSRERSMKSPRFDPKRWVEPGTTIADFEPEVGVPHHTFLKEELYELLPNFTVMDFHTETDHYEAHCIVAYKK